MTQLKWSHEVMAILQLSQKKLTWCLAEIATEVGLTNRCVRSYLSILVQLRCGVSCNDAAVEFKRSLFLSDCEYIAKTMSLNHTSFSSYFILDSTQAYCLRRQHCQNLEFCLAEHQISGRGRRSNRWHSTFASSILFTYKTTLSSHDLVGRFSPCLALVIVETLTLLFPGLAVNVKWPNDIMLSELKLAGILVDVVFSAGRIAVIVGVGCNIQSVDSGELRAACLFNGSHFTIDKTDLTVLLMQCCRRVKRALDAGGLESFARRYDQQHLLHHKAITFDFKGERRTGIVKGISDDGALRIQSGSGEVLLYSSDSISTVRSAHSDTVV